MIMNLYRRWRMRWRRMDHYTPPIGSLVDLHAVGGAWSGYWFGKVTTQHEYITGPCWNDGEKGMLVLGPSITKWRYAR